MDKKIMPIRKPKFETYQHTAYLEVVSGTSKQIDIWMMNNYIGWRCSTDINDPKLSIIKGNPWDSIPFLHRQLIEKTYIFGSVHKYVKKMILENYCAMFTGIDDYYLQGGAQYKKRHQPHDVLIYGYDDENKTYNVAGYTANQIFGYYKIKQSDLTRAYHSKFLSKDNYTCLSGLRVKSEQDCNLKIDFEQIKVELKKYLTSAKCFNEVTEYICGIKVYDYIDEYLNNIQNQNRRKIDLRISRIIWEHKKCMLERIQLLSNQFHTSHDIESAYTELLNNANIIRMLSIKYNLKSNNRTILSIRQNLKALANDEQKILSRLVECI